MNINQQYISERNSYSGQIPRYIVIHNTDNYSTGADANHPEPGSNSPL